MKTFEFQNILPTDDFPKVLGVSHISVFKNQNALKKINRALKQHFWTEVQQNAKVFHLSGLIHSQYPEVELHSLGRVFSVRKCTPLESRTTHLYMLLDGVQCPPHHLVGEEVVDHTRPLPSFMVHSTVSWE